MTAFAPRGNTEIIGICDEASRIEQLGEDHIRGLAEGLNAGLRAYHDLKYSTFNFCLYSAPFGEGHPDDFRVYASLVSRQSLVEDYRSDDYFLQKMLGTEILVDSPEEIAKRLRDQEDDQ